LQPAASLRGIARGTDPSVPLEPDRAPCARATQRQALADSLIYATARRHDAELWTQDSHFDGLPGVRYVAKP